MQCCILQASAATEEYIKAIFDGWAFKLRQLDAATAVNIPMRIRALIVKNRLRGKFSKYITDNDEKALLDGLSQESHIWALMVGNSPIPRYFDGSSIYLDQKYPSHKNIKLIFSRIGVDNVFDSLSRILKSDAEYALTAFNSVRTALAHEAPPQLTYNDVKDNLKRISNIVRAMDCLLFSTLNSYAGVGCWPCN